MRGPQWDTRARTGTRITQTNLTSDCSDPPWGLRPVGGLAAERQLMPGEIRTIMYVVDRDNAPMAGQTSMAFAYRSDYRAAVAGVAGSPVEEPAAA